MDLWMIYGSMTRVSCTYYRVHVSSLQAILRTPISVGQIQCFTQCAFYATHVFIDKDLEWNDIPLPPFSHHPIPPPLSSYHSFSSSSSSSYFFSFSSSFFSSSSFLSFSPLPPPPPPPPPPTPLPLPLPLPTSLRLLGIIVTEGWPSYSPHLSLYNQCQEHLPPGVQWRNLWNHAHCRSKCLLFEYRYMHCMWKHRYKINWWLP